MNVIVRERPLKGNRKSLYLDVYVNGNQTQETLGLYLEDDKNNPLVKQKNKETIRLAEQLKLKRLTEIQQIGLGIRIPQKNNKTFSEYFNDLVSERIKTGKNHETWVSVNKHLNDFKKPILFGELTEDFLEAFRAYLLKKVHQNSASNYFNKLKASIHRAYREKLIYENPADRVTSPRLVETHREFLTNDELNKLVEEPCKNNLLKKAFIFSCLTGLRWSDVNNLKWKNIQIYDNIPYIVYTQKKTKNSETLPISGNALELLGERLKDDERTFKGLKYSAYNNSTLAIWVSNAGIKKKITFHCARHTNAMLLLNNGVDLYTVSEMLGHRDLKTTQIYAKIMNETKIKALSKLPKIELKNLT